MVGHTTPSIRIKFLQMTTLLNKWLVEESLHYRKQIIDETDENDSKNERVLPSIPPLPPLRQTLRPIDLKLIGSSKFRIIGGVYYIVCILLVDF